MSDINEPRVFEIDFGCLLKPDDFLSYYANGMLVPTDREIFLNELSERMFEKSVGKKAHSV